MAMVAMIVDGSGVRAAADPAELRRQVDADRFFWLDIFDGDPATRSRHLSEIGMEPSDIGWALRFGQAGRIHLGRLKLRAVTWIAEPAGNLIEVHVIAWRHCIVTVWTGDPAALDEIRQQFAERACGIQKSPYHATAILLQLLLGTLDHAIRSLDSTLDDLRLRLDKDAASVDVAILTRRLQRLQSVAANFDRYSSAVRSAIVGVESIDGMDPAAAAEFDDYAEQVEDVEEQLFERRRWLADLMHDHAAGVAQRQGEQINRLTLVSLIFLPVTALTGFFGMNFEWMNQALTGKEAFFVLGVALPLVCMAATVVWLVRRGLIQIKWRPVRATAPAGEIEDRGFWASARWEATSPAGDTNSATAKLPG
jgi:Mg2+ and Co2+ transporter CorA